MAELLTNNIWEVCLGIVKYQGVQLMVLENFGELSFWIVDSFSTKGIGQSYNELTGKDITQYLSHQAFYSPSGKSLLEQAQGVKRVTMKFGHDNYIWVLNVE